jgi:hypothetical protein
MSFSYSGAPSNSDLDEVRFYLGDTDPDDVLLQDEEVQFIIDKWKPVHASNLFNASVCADMISGHFAREVTISADGVSIQMSELQQKFQSLATDLRNQNKLLNASGVSPDVGGIMFGEVYDQSIAPLVWAKQMHDNRRAGRQDYGGEMTSFDMNGLLGGDSGLVTETP